MAQVIAYKYVKFKVKNAVELSDGFELNAPAKHPDKPKSLRKAQKQNHERHHTHLHTQFIHSQFNAGQLEDHQDEDLVDPTAISDLYRSLAHALFIELKICKNSKAKHDIADELAFDILRLEKNNIGYKRAKVTGSEISFLKEKLKEKDFLILGYNDHTSHVKSTLKKLEIRLGSLSKRQKDTEQNKQVKRQCYEVIYHLHRYQNLNKMPLLDKDIINPGLYTIVTDHRKKTETYYETRFKIIKNTILTYLNNPGAIIAHKLLSKLPLYHGKLDSVTLDLIEKLNYLGGKKIISDYFDAYFNVGNNVPEDPKAMLDGFLASVHANILELQEKNLKPYGITNTQKKVALIRALKIDANRFTRKNNLSLKIANNFQASQYINKSITLLEACKSSFIEESIQKHLKKIKANQRFTFKNKKSEVDILKAAKIAAKNEYEELLLRLKNMPEAPPKSELESLEKIYTSLSNLYKYKLSIKQILDFSKNEYVKLHSEFIFNEIKNKIDQGEPKEKQKYKKIMTSFFQDNFDDITKFHKHHELLTLDKKHKTTGDDYCLASVEAKPMGYKEFSFRRKKAIAKLLAQVTALSIAIGQGVLGFFALITLLGLNPVLAVMVALTTVILNKKLFYKDTLDTLVQLFIKADWFNGAKSFKGKGAMIAVFAMAAGMSAVMGGLTFVAVMGIPAFPFAIALTVGTYLGVTSFLGFLGVMYVAFASVSKKFANFAVGAIKNAKIFSNREMSESKGAIKKYLYSPIAGLLKASVYTVLNQLTPKNDYSNKVLNGKLKKTRKMLKEAQKRLNNARENATRQTALKEVRDLKRKLARLEQPSFKQLGVHFVRYWKNPLDFDYNTTAEKVDGKIEKIIAQRKKAGEAKLSTEEIEQRRQDATQKQNQKVALNHNVKAYHMIKDKEEAQGGKELSEAAKLKIKKNVARKENVKRAGFVIGKIFMPFFMTTACAMLAFGTIFTLLGWQPQFVDFLHTWLGLYKPVAEVVSAVLVFGFCGVVDGAFNLLNEMSFFAWANKQASNAVAHLVFAIKDTVKNIGKGIVNTIVHPRRTFKDSIEQAKTFKKQGAAAFINAKDNPRKYVLPLLQFIFVDTLWHTVLLLANASGFAALSLGGATTPAKKALSFSTVLTASVSCNTITGVLPPIRSRTPNCSDNHIHTQKNRPDVAPGRENYPRGRHNPNPPPRDPNLGGGGNPDAPDKPKINGIPIRIGKPRQFRQQQAFFQSMGNDSSGSFRHCGYSSDRPFDLANPMVPPIGAF